GCIPLLSYTTTREEIRYLLNEGHFLLKISLGAPGGPEDMLAADKRRLSEIHAIAKDVRTPHTTSARILYYLDANGRYLGREQVSDLLAYAEREGFLERIALFEEPFSRGRRESVQDFPVTFVADESLGSVKDLSTSLEQGFRAATLKPAGKGLSVTLRMTREAVRLGLIPLVSDSSCPPLLLDWNKNLAARLPSLSELKMAVMETNGPQYFEHWDAMLARHPDAGQRWVRPEKGTFRLDKEFY